MKRLTKSRTNRVMSGILGGVGEYFNIDPLIVRILFVVFTFATGFGGGVILYIIGMVIIPERRDSFEGYDPSDGTISDHPFDQTESSFPKTYSSNSWNGSIVIGAIFILLGGLFLLNNVLDTNLFYYLRQYREYFWAFALVGVGLLLILVGGRKR